jgi:hypothetical protein
MIQGWKVLPILKGISTCVPIVNAWRLRRASTGGSDSCRYCYSVWLRHLIVLDSYGFRIKGAHIGELGPGDSIGMGLAALLSGADSYVGLDIVPFSAAADLESMLAGLSRMYSNRESIPDHNEFPRIRPRLDSYQFPDRLVELGDCTDRAEEIRGEIRKGVNRSQLLNYRAPWTSLDEIASGSLDLIFSQAVLEHIDDLEQTYDAMSSWLKQGGYASHVIDFSSHDLSPFWNGHWAYTKKEWRMVRGRREYLLSRQPVSVHLSYAQRVGLEILHVQKDYGDKGIDVCSLSEEFSRLDSEYFRTRGVVLILRKR